VLARVLFGLPALLVWIIEEETGDRLVCDERLCCTNGVMARLPLYPGRPIPRFL
jgi:hypothetical protein